MRFFLLFLKIVLELYKKFEYVKIWSWNPLALAYYACLELIHLSRQLNIYESIYVSIYLKLVIHIYNKQNIVRIAYNIAIPPPLSKYLKKMSVQPLSSLMDIWLLN